MTVTTVIQGYNPATDESVDVIVADKSGLVLMSLDQDPKTKRSTAIYALSGSDPGYPITLTVNSDPPGADVKSRYCSITFRTWVNSVYSATDEEKYWPVQASVSFVIPGDAPVTPALLSQLVDVAFSYTYLSVTTGVKDTTWLAAILLGSPETA